MKFKLKLPKCRKCVVVVDDSESPTIGSLKQATADELVKLGISGYHFNLSLNGKEAVQGEITEKIQELGIVPGDLLHVLFDESVPNLEELVAELGPTSDSSRTSSNESQELARTSPRSEVSEGSREKLQFNGISTPTKDLEERSTNKMSEPELPSTSEGFRGNDARTNETVDGEQPIDRVIVNRYLNEPILCRESSSTAVPEILTQSYQLSEVKSPIEAMVVVLHVLMLESGFVPRDTGRSDAVRLPATAKVGHIYRIVYVHTSCPEQTAVFTCIPVGNLLSINANAGTCTSQLSVKPEAYVRKSQLNASNVASVYENIPKLSYLFKDNIVYPLLAVVLADGGFAPYGMMSMATEVKLLILSFLDMRSLLRASEVCKEFHSLADDPALWKRLCFTDFPENMSHRFVTENSISWKEKYKVLYAQKQQRLTAMRSFINMAPPFAPFTPFGPPGFPGIFPPRIDPYNPFQPIGPSAGGIFGGEYDRIPGGITTLIPDRGPFGPPPPPYRRQGVSPLLPGFLPARRRPSWPGLPQYHHYEY